MSDAILAGAQSAEFKNSLAQLLLSICQVDTTPQSDLAALATAEHRVFELIEDYLKSLEIPGLCMARVPMNAEIERHAFYSRPYYTISPEHPDEQPAAVTYANRHNLIVTIDPPGARGAGLALNAHIDVVKPYILPRIEGDTLFGRGACDDKGPAVSILGALQLLGDQLKRTGGTIQKPLTIMFVIEEEMGGNGSLSLAISRGLRTRYDTLAVLECCSGNIFPGNRGAIWYKVQARARGINLFETAAYIIAEMEREGRAIKAESRHDLFPHRPVQTCHGMLGPFGEHPSRICGRVDFAIRFGGSVADFSKLKLLISDLIESGLNQYTSLYGDKTQVVDPATGTPKVDHHYDLVFEPDRAVVRVHGSTGHMGSILQNDGAITKMASMLRSLLESRPAIERAAGGPISFELLNWPDMSRLAMEGGQGFLPTHPMPEVMTRLRAAVLRGARRHFDQIGRRDLDPAEVFDVTFDKLHNAAFAGNPNSAAMQSAVQCAKAAGIWKDQPIRGWDVSCDARIFACEYPDLTVITTGPGHLIHAHADNEQIDLADLAKFSGFLAKFMLEQIGE